MLDASYYLAKKAAASSGADAKDKLQAMFPTASWDEIVDAYFKGCELAKRCYEIGNLARQKSIPDEEAIQMLKGGFPGFSDATYSDALTLGWFLSR